MVGRLGRAYGFPLRQIGAKDAEISCLKPFAALAKGLRTAYNTPLASGNPPKRPPRPSEARQMQTDDVRVSAGIRA